MQIVMVKNVKNVGKVGEVKEVTRGYALNYLIPQGIATVASKGTIKEAQMRAKKYEKSATVDLDKIAELVREINGLEISIKVKVNEKGVLFSSIKEDDIAAEIAEKINKDIDTKYIVLKEHIKNIGEYEVAIVAGESKGKIVVKIEAE